MSGEVVVEQRCPRCGRGLITGLRLIREPTPDDIAADVCARCAAVTREMEHLTTQLEVVRSLAELHAATFMGSSAVFARRVLAVLDWKDER